jgi:hypothetical protein
MVLAIAGKERPNASLPAAPELFLPLESFLPYLF